MQEIQTRTVEMTCITCPVGCALSAQILSDGRVQITGNKCPRGAAYGEKELTNPTRTVTSTIRVEGRENTVVAVKTTSDIPKGKIMECMKALRNAKVKLPVNVGDIVISNVANTGVDIVVTKKLEK